VEGGRGKGIKELGAEEGQLEADETGVWSCSMFIGPAEAFSGGD